MKYNNSMFTWKLVGSIFLYELNLDMKHYYYYFTCWQLSWIKPSLNNWNSVESGIKHHNPSLMNKHQKFWTAFEVTRLARKVPQGILKNALTFHYSKSNMVAPARLLKKVLRRINSSEIHQFTFISYSKKDNSSKTRDGCKWTRQIVQLYTWTQIKVKEHGFYCCSTFHIHSLCFNI
jgi:hypothetical protein